jgi:hypothetical protein
MSIARGQGRWVPLHTGYTRYLPKDRPFTELEAAYSVQVDHDRQNAVTIMGYAKQWRWSRGKVVRFLLECGAQIMYPETTSRKQNQRGQIMIQTTSRDRTDGGQIKLINSNVIDDDTDRPRTDGEQMSSRSQGTTIQKLDKRHDKKKKSNPSSSSSDDGRALFDSFWGAYPRKTHKREALAEFIKLKPKANLVREMVQVIEKMKLTQEWQRDDGQFIPYPKKWLNERRWEDDIPDEPSGTLKTGIFAGGI